VVIGRLHPHSTTMGVMRGRPAVIKAIEKHKSAAETGARCCAHLARSYLVARIVGLLVSLRRSRV
jgi:hypothetical protein